MCLNSYGLILLFALLATVLAADDEDNENCNGQRSICVTKKSYRVCSVKENGESHAFGPTFQCPANFVCDSEAFHGSCHRDLPSTASTAATTQTTPTSTMATSKRTTTTEAVPPTPENTSTSSGANSPLTTSDTTAYSTYSTTSTMATTERTTTTEAVPRTSENTTHEPIDFTSSSAVTSSTTTPNYSSVDKTTPADPSSSGQSCPGGANAVNRQYVFDFNFSFWNNGLQRRYRPRNPCLNNFPPWLKVSLW